MSHRQMASRSSILKYFESMLKEAPREQGSPPLAVTNAHPAPTKTCNLKVKRRKTRRELNRNKFGLGLSEKLPRRKPWAQGVGRASECRCRRVRAEAGAAKPSVPSSWVITQNRLSQKHLGIFNREVKSIAAERLPLSDGQGDAGEPAPATAEVATPVPGKGAEPPEAPVVELSSPTPEPARKGPQLTVTPRPPAPVTEVAQKLIQALGTQRAFPGQSLVQQTQQQLLELLVKRHGHRAARLLTTARNATENSELCSGIEPPEGHVIASNASASGDLLMEETSLGLKEQPCKFPVHSTALMVNGFLYRQQQCAGFSGGTPSVCVRAAATSPAACLQQEVTDGDTLFAASQAGTCFLRPRCQVQELSSVRRLWANAGPFQRAKVSGTIFPSPLLCPSRSDSAWDLLTRAASETERNQEPSPLRIIATPDSHSSPVRDWEFLGRVGHSCFPGQLRGPAASNLEENGNRGLPLGDIVNVSQPQGLAEGRESTVATRRHWFAYKNTGLAPPLYPAQARAGALPLPLAFYYPPSGALEWADSPVPGWGRTPQTPTWEPTSPEPWVYPRMKLY
ncbi:uncharacterized protein LOC125448485 [Stegostoma tigrinum]|uniref:uncharacterized protein LOC125448485 n=1 Tax=Stegostoma tigrinum TaxID=3053191 RepID=UPI00286FB4C7|nr:uncharacterized protein LOC125448485 [Stegostoma tigrinum]